nr:PREDICTED: mannose-6-phosphate isomerase isoform X1 [Bemisia tabaci]
MMELSCAVQHYEWGKAGSNSAVAVLRQSADPTFLIDEDKPYAELWMGTHVNGPSIVSLDNVLLSDWIARNPGSLGKKLTATFGQQLPFLFKILSINKALSIQAHPSLDHAQELNQKFPHLYKDANHKPELAIALTKFEALCGFRSVSDLKKHLQSIPELSTVIGDSLVSKFLESDEENVQNQLKQCFKALMTAEESLVESQLLSLISRLESSDENSKTEYQLDLLKRIHDQFPGDVGCFGIYLFNYIILAPGEAIYLGANEIHSYISGDCVECMACSDNVVRAGLTPKFKDVETLCSMLQYNAEPPCKKLFQSISEDSNTSIFLPPVPDFAVAVIKVGNSSEYQLIPRDSASICIVVQGCASSENLVLKKGKVIFLNANQSMTLKTSQDSETFVCFQAFCNC